MMPEYLLYKLCGKKAREYTNATTTGLVNAYTRAYDREIIEALSLPDRLFPQLDAPGTILGEYDGCKCVLCATHDTASAVEGVPMDEDCPYISSGTWSLLGVKTPAPRTDEGSMLANYSNEGGLGYIRYQKNIMGMWLVNSLQKEICPELAYSQIVKLAKESVYDITVDANDPAFLSPDSMKAVFDKFTENKLLSVGDYFRCAYRSLALCYSDSLAQLERNVGRSYDKIYIVGGGANNTFLNSLTAEFTGKNVVALPIEATALGNLKIQMEA
jgi:rhamnulokinase